MLYVVSNIVGDMWFIYSCDTRDTSLHATLGSLLVFIFCVYTLGTGGWCCCFCIVMYQCVNSALTCFSPAENSCVPLQHPLYLLVDCCSVSFGIMSNNSAIIFNTAWWVPFNVMNVAVGAGLCNAYIKSCAASIAASADETLGSFTFFVKKSTMSEMRSDISSDVFQPKMSCLLSLLGM